MELWQLKYFLAVADKLNYGRAAERLNVTQPAVTRAVQGLENELGVTLFLRDKRRVQLTPTGRVFADEARGLLAGLETSARQARRVERGEAGTLTIGFEGSSIFTFAFIPRAVQAFYARYPDVTIDLLEMHAADQATALKDRRIELGFVVPPIDDPAIEVEVMGSESLILAMPAVHRLAQQPTVKLAQLAGERFIGTSTACGTNRPIMVALSAAGVEQLVARVCDTHLRLCFVAAGLGLTLVPASVAELRPAEISYRPLQPPVHFELAVARLKSAQADAALERFVETARHAYQAHDSKLAVVPGGT
jgi:DNA-binding transcriptional LysR family regulator